MQRYRTIIENKIKTASVKSGVYLLKNEDIRTKFGEISRKIIEERNDYYKEMEKMESIYKELIERHKK